MILIHEVQFDNYGGSQERRRTYKSWDKYLEDLQKVDGMKDDMFPTLPRQTKAINLEITENKVEYEFLHPVFNEIYKGYTEIVS